jgi:hypothetical protein
MKISELTVRQSIELQKIIVCNMAQISQRLHLVGLIL